MKQIRFTKEGYEKMNEEYEKLKASRPDAVDHLKRARDMGDLSENGYYKASRAKLSSIDHRLFQTKLFLKQAVVIQKTNSTLVSIGTTVRLYDGKREYAYQIVGDLEANPQEGKISLLSPIGKAIEGKKQGDEILFNSPAGKITYKIIAIS
jgi:transcription elongation factor GreA